MLNDIIKGVSQKLHAAFGDSYRVYKDDVKQNFQTPCFSVSIINSEISPLPSSRYISRNSFDILYFPSGRNDTDELREAAECMMAQLEYVPLPNGGLLHGVNIRWEIVDNVLHFFISYNYLLKRLPDYYFMENLSLKEFL